MRPGGPSKLDNERKTKNLDVIYFQDDGTTFQSRTWTPFVKGEQIV